MYSFVRNHQTALQSRFPLAIHESSYSFTSCQYLLSSAPTASWLPYLDAYLDQTQTVLMVFPSSPYQTRSSAQYFISWVITWPIDRNLSFFFDTLSLILCVQRTLNFLIHFIFIMPFGLAQFSLAPLVPVQPKILSHPGYGKSPLTGLLVSTLFPVWHPK